MMLIPSKLRQNKTIHYLIGLLQPRTLQRMDNIVITSTAEITPIRLKVSTAIVISPLILRLITDYEF